jgi:hypothetical protein
MRLALYWLRAQALPAARLDPSPLQKTMKRPEFSRRDKSGIGNEDLVPGTRCLRGEVKHLAHNLEALLGLADR